MGAFVDFQQIKTNIGIVQVLDMLGVKSLKPHGEALRGHCPCCKEGNDRAFVVTPAKNSFYCFSERKGGDVIELASRYYRIPQREAAQRIAAHFGINGATRTDPDQGGGEGRPEAPAQPSHVPASGFDAKAYQASLDPAHQALKDCGFSEQTIRDFGGGYCSRGLNRGRLVLPVHDGEGSILAFMGLALKGEQPDILYPKGFAPPDFFNIHRLEGSTLFLVHSPRDVLRAWDAQLVDVICPLKPITPELLDALAVAMRERRCETLEAY